MRVCVCVAVWVDHHALCLSGVSYQPSFTTEESYISPFLDENPAGVGFIRHLATHQQQPSSRLFTLLRSVGGWYLQEGTEGD